MAPAAAISREQPSNNPKQDKLGSKRITSAALSLLSLVAVLFVADVGLKQAGWHWQDADFDLQSFTRFGRHRDFPGSGTTRANFLFPKSTDQVGGKNEVAVGQHDFSSHASFRHRVLGGIAQDSLEAESLGVANDCPAQSQGSRAFVPFKVAPHVSILGSGRTECTVGEVCAFRVVSTSETYWDTDDPSKREIFFTYKGPSRGAGDLSVEYSGVHPAWIATYTIWDEGSYTFTVKADCNSVMESSVLAQFPVTIRKAEPLLEASSSEPAEDSSKILQEGFSIDSPCKHGATGRWLRSDGEANENGQKAKYVWTPYSCASNLEDPHSFVKRLNDAGFTRLTFIGDSHQRVLYMHLKYLLAGHADASERRQHGDMAFTVREGESLLELRYYWVDGIYQNHEFGCHNRGMYSGRNDSFPNVEPGPGIYIFDAGTWTTASCTEPQLAYAKHLPGYLEWAETFKQEGSKLVWRTTPSWRGACNRKNAVLAWTNRYAIPMVTARRNFQIFNSWEVEAPRYHDLCDWHYSCLKGKKDRMVMKGDVGEAVTRSLMTWLVNKMK